MYNPTRMNPNNLKRNSQRRYNPHAGRKHSDIIANQGPKSVFISDLAQRISTDRGWKIVHFEGEDFEVVYEYICSKNATGKIVNKEGDRCIRVLSGQIFLTVNADQISLRTGQAYPIPKGLEYELATLGTEDAEVLFCQKRDYEKEIEQLTESTAQNAKMIAVMPKDPTLPSRISSDKAKLAASKIQEQRDAREKILRSAMDRGQPMKAPANITGEENTQSSAPIKARPPLAGQNVSGFSPMPVGARGFGDD